MIPVFKSIKNSLLLPTPNGSGINVYLNEYIRGSYYTFFETIGFLLDVTDQNIDPSLIKFTYPETPGQTTGNTPIGTITSVTVGPGLTGGGTEGDIDIGLAAGGITAAMIGSGQVVKLLNTFTDTIDITAGYGINVNSSLNTIEIVNAYPGLLTLDIDAPLHFSLGLGNQQLNGYIAITPTNDGGAIAKQTQLPIVRQEGYIALEGGGITINDGYFRLDSSLDTSNVSNQFSRFLLTTNLQCTYQFALLSENAPIFIPGVNEPLVTSLDEYGYFKTISASIYGNFNVVNSDSEELININNSDLVDSSFDINIQTNLINTLNLLPEASIEGAVNSKPLINLTNTSGSIPAILVSNDTNTNAALVWQTKNNAAEVTSKLDTDGNLTVNSLTANTLRYKYTYIDTAQTYNVLTNGPQVIIANCSSGAVIVQLPDLTAEFETETITVTVKKIDATSNSLSVVPANGHYIDGSGSTINLTTKNSSLTLVGTLINDVRHWWKVSEI